MISEGVSEEGILVLEKFLNFSDVSELSDLLKQSEIGKKGVEELQFVSENIKLHQSLECEQLMTFVTGFVYEWGRHGSICTHT